MKYKIAIYLPLFCILSYWYVELAAVLFSVLLSGNITKLFNGLKLNYLILLVLFIGLEIFIMAALDYNIRKFFEQVGLIVTTAIAYRAYFIYVLRKNISLFVK